MNITSYNVTDVGYHYIGLRVLNGLPPVLVETNRRGPSQGMFANTLQIRP